MELRGKPYYMGGVARHPITGEQAKVNHYGGYVCSRRCDIRACVELEGTMPGCGSVNGYNRLSCYAKDRIKSNWPEE
jgi:hypothetical protein